jgi:single-strand DNA-binding protein
MAGLNKVILIGRIGKDPETYQFEDGTKKISFSLATTESYRDKSTEEWKDITEWHNIVGYRYLAERNVAKGDLVYVEGKIKTRKYKDKDGNDRYLTEIVAEKLNMLSRYQAGEGRPATTITDQTGNSAEKSSTPNEEDSATDDLPF